MKRQYQISKRRAAEKFEQWAKSNPVPIQLTFPTAGIAELAQHSLGDLLRAVGKVFIETVMESEVRELAGSDPSAMRSGAPIAGEVKPAFASSTDSGSASSARE